MSYTKPISLEETVEKLKSGEKDPETYVTEVCQRIDEIDNEINSLVHECDRQSRLLSDLNNLTDDGEKTGQPLYSIPVGIKDIIHVDGFTTRAGAVIPPELIQGPEATVASRIKDAGGLIIKTVTTEFGGGGPALTRNPHNRNHTPGGSSSGSAAAVAAGICPLAVGTQTGGSVIRPASYCGVFGFKPSYDRIPADGRIKNAETLDTVGLYTQSIRDMQLGASVVCDGWETTSSDRKPIVAVPEGPYLEDASADGMAEFREMVKVLEKSGYTVKRITCFENIDEIKKRQKNLSSGEVALNSTELYEKYRSFFRVKRAERIEEGQQVTMKELIDARKLPKEMYEMLEEKMEEHSIDIWIAPAAPSSAPETIASTGNAVMNQPWTTAGLPVATLPVGKVNGLPFGLQCIGRFNAGEDLLNWSEMLYQSFE